MSLLQKIYFENSLQEWLVALAVGLAVYFIFLVVRSMIVKRLQSLARKTSNDLDDFVVSILQMTRKVFIFALAFYIASLSLKLEVGFLKFIHPALLFLVLYQVWVWGNQSLIFLTQKLVKRDKDLQDSDQAVSGTMPAILFLGRLTILSLILILALGNLGFDITALVASLGVGGIAVALAVQNILGDLFASLSIVLDKPFKVGDFIVVDDLSGNVEKIGLKTTRIRSLSGEQLVFCNNDLLSSRVRNFKQMNERRIVFAIGVTYDTAKEKLEKIPGLIKEIIDRADCSRFDRAHFKSFGAFSLDFEVVYFVLVPEFPRYMDVQQEINLAIFKKFDEEGIEFAFPTQTIIMHQEKSASS